MKNEANNPPSSVMVNVDIRDLFEEAGRLTNRAAEKAAIGTHFYLLQTVPRAAWLVWNHAHHGHRDFNPDSTEGKRLIFELLTFTHYRAVIRALVHQEAIEQWRGDGSAPTDFVATAESGLKLFFDREGMSRIVDVDDVAWSDGWLDPDAPLNFDRRIATYLNEGSPEKADGYFIGYLEPALECGTLSPTQQVEYRKIFHLIAAGVDSVIDPAPRDVLILPLSIGTEMSGEGVVEAVKEMFANEESKRPLS